MIMYNNNYGWGQPQQQIQMPQFMDDRTAVNDQSEAENMPVLPGNIVHFWHRTEPIIYERRRDLSGREYPLVIMKYSCERVKSKEELYEERIRTLEDLVMRMGAKEVPHNAEQ